jgi:hypothetical protein
MELFDRPSVCINSDVGCGVVKNGIGSDGYGFSELYGIIL